MQVLANLELKKKLALPVLLQVIILIIAISFYLN